MVALGLAAMGLALRSTGDQVIFADDQVVPSVGDAWYHLRRIVFDAVNFPEMLGFDPFVQFPQGASAPWPPLFDALVAWGAMPFSGKAGAKLAEYAMWAPPLIGAITVACLYLVLERRLGMGPALAAAVLLAILPAHVAATHVGALSQRCAGGLVAVLVLGAALRFVESSLRSWGAALASGFLMGLGLLFSSGGVLVVAAVQLGLLWLLAVRPAVEATSAVSRFIVLQLCALLVVVPAAALRLRPWSELFTASYPSRTHLAFFVVPAVIGLVWLAVARSPLGSRRSLRLLSMLVLAVVGVVAGGLLVPPVLDGGVTAWRAIFGPVSIAADRAEPPLVAGSLLHELTVWGWAVPFLLPLLAWRARRGPASTLFALGVSAVLLGVAFSVPGSHALGSVAIALVTGVVVAAAATLVSPRLPGVAGGIAVAVVFGLLALPGLLRRGAADMPPTISVSGIDVPASRVLAVAHWLRDFTPPVAGWREAKGEPKYGVVAPWELGDVFSFSSHRPTVINSLSTPDRLARSREAFVSSPGIGAGAMTEWLARYLVMPVGLHDALGSPSPVALGRALLKFDGSEVEPVKPRDPPPVYWFRLVYELGEPSDPATLRVYERVTGARVAGVTMPRRTVTARIDLRTHDGREFTWRTSARSNVDSGYYELYLPYSTEGGRFRRFVEPRSDWVIECEGERRTLSVIDWKVRDGGMVRGPHFCFR